MNLKELMSLGMDLEKQEQYFKTEQQEDLYILKTQMQWETKHLLFSMIPIISLSFIIGIVNRNLVTTLIITSLIAIFFAIGYGLFRVAAFQMYKEIIFNTKSQQCYIQNTFFGKKSNPTLIDKKYNLEKLSYQPLTRSGKTRYSLRYTTHKTYHLMVIRTDEDKLIIENFMQDIDYEKFSN
ncbi:hypothetical protein SAMN05216480_109134 [Pustulibacterium marinum]|uniref:Uncharacterized protein n=1 Tax=Pustulibacterium marinum TaxID=1224947 RepID=A0A1I7HJR8_9FLAO|nr:hypothetical protein [Pustulibacterium marinum]SFU60726.1 hypothetical protein SAMN05216480_109134 [Pustulibacterium marinum]